MEKIFEAKNIKECLDKAYEELDVSEEEIDYEVLQESTHGFLGIGAKNAVIRVKFNDRYNINSIRKFLSRLLDFYGVNAKIAIDVIRPMVIYSVRINGKDSLSELIGKHGHTLSAIEHLVSVYMNKHNDHHVSISVDVNDYKKRKEEIVKRMAESAVAKIKRGTKKISLEPMSARERKIVHEVLSKYDDIRSYSVGTEPYRYVVVEKVRVRVKG